MGLLSSVYFGFRSDFRVGIVFARSTYDIIQICNVRIILFNYFSKRYYSNELWPPFCFFFLFFCCTLLFLINIFLVIFRLSKK